MVLKKNKKTPEMQSDIDRFDEFLQIHYIIIQEILTNTINTKASICVPGFESEDRQSFVDCLYEYLIDYSQQFNFISIAEILKPTFNLPTSGKKFIKTLSSCCKSYTDALHLLKLSQRSIQSSLEKNKNEDFETWHAIQLDMAFDLLEVKLVQVWEEELTPSTSQSPALLTDTIYRNVFNNNHSNMLLLEPEDGMILEANPAACEFYGYTREEITSLSISDLNIMTDEEVRKRVELAKTFQKNIFVFQHIMADGTIKDVEVSSGPVILDGRKILFSIVYDITERKKNGTSSGRKRRTNAQVYECS